MTNKTKEEIYDEKIAHLMTDIIKVCIDNKIAMIASFAIPNEDYDGLLCTTALLDDDCNPTESLRRAKRALMPTEVITSMIITKRKSEDEN